MTIEELITYCEKKEYNHRLSCKRYDDASGYTRSKDKNIRTACAIREEKYGDYYKEISATMRKYQMFQADYEVRLKADMVDMLTEIQMEIDKMTDTAVDPRTITITSWKGMQKKICDLIQQKIDKLKEVGE